MATNYFANIFKSSACNRLEECLDAIPYKVTINMQEILSSEYSAEEVKTALF